VSNAICHQWAVRKCTAIWIHLLDVIVVSGFVDLAGGGVSRREPF
jgi:hypothetical protein